LHQPEFDVWNWSGDADLIEFINIAQEEDLFVLLKPGPIILYFSLGYLNYVELYLTTVLNKIKPYLRGNGGPIIMIENQYGSYEACDYIYMYSSNLNASFELMRRYQSNGPLVNSEFYTGRLTHWEEPFQKVSANAVRNELDEMLALGASVNL
ncbi:hypothetical protein M0802_015085, partial [Mischocyttarus mexicanus]